MSAQAFTARVAGMAPHTSVATAVATGVNVSVSSAVAIGLGSLALVGGLLSASLGVGIQKLADMSVNTPSGQMHIAAAAPTPGGMYLIGSLDTPGSAEAVKVVGQYAYIADGTNGVVIADISNPQLPKIVGTYTYVGADYAYAYDIDVEGRYAYVAHGGPTLTVLDVSNPAQPRQIGQYNRDSEGFSTDVQVVGRYAYVGDRQKFLIIDISTPENPTLVGSYGVTNNDDYFSFASNSRYVYTQGSILDVSTRTNIVKVGTYPGAGTGVRGPRPLVDGSKLYVPGTPGYVLSILDATAGTSTAPLSQYPLRYYPMQVASDYTATFIATGLQKDLIALDITASSSPVLLATASSNDGIAVGVTTANGYVYSVWKTGGLKIYKLLVPGDSTKPALGVTSPVANLTSLTAVLTVQGTASDAASGLDRVEVSVNGSAPARPVVGAYNAWSTGVTLAPGINTITVRAYDRAGNVSTQTVSNITYITNLALSKPVTVKSGADANSSKVTDADTASYWCSKTPAASGDWVYVDLGSVKQVKRVSVDATFGVAGCGYATQFEIQFATTGTSESSWTTFGTQANDQVTSNYGIRIEKSAYASARYVRFKVIGIANGNLSVKDFQVIGH
jgi:hypothetical protein